MTCINHEVPPCVMPRYVYSGALCLHTHVILSPIGTSEQKYYLFIPVFSSLRSKWNNNNFQTVYYEIFVQFIPHNCILNSPLPHSRVLLESLIVMYLSFIL